MPPSTPTLPCHTTTRSAGNSPADVIPPSGSGIGPASCPGPASTPGPASCGALPVSTPPPSGDEPEPPHAATVVTTSTTATDPGNRRAIHPGYTRPQNAAMAAHATSSGPARNP